MQVWNKCDAVEAGGDAGGLQPATASGLLPPAVEALLQSDAGDAAGAYRPTAVATSVLYGQGLQELLAAVEHKVREGACGTCL